MQEENNINKVENLSLKDEEFTIIDSPEDKRRKKILQIFNEIAEDEERDIRLGEVVYKVENIHFEDSELGQCLVFEEILDTKLIFDVNKVTEAYSAQNGKMNKKYSYSDFARIMQAIVESGLIANNTKEFEETICSYMDSDKEANASWRAVYKFLLDNQNKDISLDLSFREKNGKRTAYFDVNKNDKKVQHDIKVRDIDEVCSILNAEKKSKEEEFEYKIK
ncbi:MAG: hypothetical protein IKQ31_00410 [Clostridia bacterium]|nr:hypothetical protein [Clostridia bacterium]